MKYKGLLQKVGVAPKAHGILGITFIRGQADETANMHEFDRLIERAQKYFGPPSREAST